MSALSSASSSHARWSSLLSLLRFLSVAEAAERDARREGGRWEGGWGGRGREREVGGEG